MTPRLRLTLGLAVSLLLLAAALYMPTGWYDTLPRSRNAAQPPIRGTTLLRLILGLQAVAVAVVALRGWRWASLPTALLVQEWGPRAEPDDVSERQAWRGLAVVTLLAAALRVYGLGNDLWIDELLTLRDFIPLSVGEIVGSYSSPNNHLLITLLAKATLAIFGEHEWSFRLASAAFGVASIPALYRVARLAMSRRSSLGAALLLAVSYHHVFFSQNARGFVPYVFFALVATRALVDALREEKATHWLLFGVASLLGLTALLNSAFVIAAALLVVTVVVWRFRARGVAVGPLLRRVALVFSVTGLCCFSVYAVALPDAYMLITRAYTRSGTGSAPTSSDLVNVVIRGIADGFGPQALLAAIPFMALAAAGLFVLWRRQWAVTTLLLMPGVFTAAVLASRGMMFSPRHFLLWLPLAVLMAAVTVDALTQRLRAAAPGRRHTMAVALVLLMALMSTLSLRRYYRVPKQPYVATLRYVEETRGADDLVYTIHPSWVGMRYYAARLTLPGANHYVPIRSVEMLDSALALRNGRRVRVVTTLERVTNKTHRELLDRVRAGWQRDTTFAATIGDGELSVWSERSDALTRDTGRK